MQKNAAVRIILMPRKHHMNRNAVLMPSSSLLLDTGDAHTNKWQGRRSTSRNWVQSVRNVRVRSYVDNRVCFHFAVRYAQLTAQMYEHEYKW